MPVTIKPATHGASKTPYRYFAQNTSDLLNNICEKKSRECEEILQSSFSDAGLEAANVLATNNGFVNSAIKAYSHHHHLTVRPEDVWFAILSQLSIWINNHAEKARGKFVAHEGKKELMVIMNGCRNTVDYGVFAEEMTREIEQNVADPELREWIMPAFTTTTANDTVVASILMMGALQEYFNYTLMVLCGLPSVNLQGEKSDWEALFKKLDKLSTLGEEPAQFAKVLAPVLSRFVRSFDDPTNKDIIAFWQQIFFEIRHGSGSTDYNGWITAFCFWSDKGRNLHAREYHGRARRLQLDGVTYHSIDSSDVPSGSTSVPVKLDDNGEVFDTVMVAGSVGTRYTSSGKVVAEGGLGLDSVSVVSGWWMFVKKAGGA